MNKFPAYSLRLLTTKGIRALMKAGKQIQVLHERKRHGSTFIVDFDNPKIIYGMVSKCVLSNFDTELTSTYELHSINQTKGIKPI
jgi:hypothetical protein